MNSGGPCVSAKNRRYALAISLFGSHRRVAIDQNQGVPVLEGIAVLSAVPPLTFSGTEKSTYYDKMKPRAIFWCLIQIPNSTHYHSLLVYLRKVFVVF